MKIWVDDLKLPPDEDWIWAQTSCEAKTLLKREGVEVVSLDYDLSSSTSCAKCKNEYPEYCDCLCHAKYETGHDIALWMEENKIWPGTCLVHTYDEGGKLIWSVINKHLQESGSPTPKNPV